MKKTILALSITVLAAFAPAPAAAADAGPVDASALSDAGPAVALDAGPAADGPVEIPGIPSDGWEQAEELYEAIRAGDKRKAAALALILVTALVRLLVKRWGALGRWVNESDWGGAALVFVLSFLGGLANSIAAQAPFGLGTISASFDLAVMAAGGYAVLWRKLLRPLLGKAWGAVAG